jgi:hypothetical protein
MGGDHSINKAPPGVKSHTVIDSTGLKVFGEGEWKVKSMAGTPPYLA